MPVQVKKSRIQKKISMQAPLFSRKYGCSVLLCRDIETAGNSTAPRGRKQAEAICRLPPALPDEHHAIIYMLYSGVF